METMTIFYCATQLEKYLGKKSGKQISSSEVSIMINHSVPKLQSNFKYKVSPVTKQLSCSLHVILTGKPAAVKTFNLSPMWNDIFVFWQKCQLKPCQALRKREHSYLSEGDTSEWVEKWTKTLKWLQKLHSYFYRGCRKLKYRCRIFGIFRWPYLPDLPCKKESKSDKITKRVNLGIKPSRLDCYAASVKLVQWHQAYIQTNKTKDFRKKILEVKFTMGIAKAQNSIQRKIYEVRAVHIPAIWYISRAFARKCGQP